MCFCRNRWGCCFCGSPVSVNVPCFLTIDKEQIELDAVKKSEDGSAVVIRFHEFAGSRQKVTVKPGFAFRCWTESDLRERPIGDWMENNEIRMNIKPFEIKTILIRL